PDVVVKRADKVFSGSRDLLRAVRGAVEAALSSGSASWFTGTSMPSSEMIWSAVFRRSEDFNGERGLIWTGLAAGSKKGRSFHTFGLFLNMVQRHLHVLYGRRKFGCGRR